MYVTNLTFVVLLAHQEYLYSNRYWNKSLITQWVLYITKECVNKDKKVELYVVEKGKMPNSLSKIRRVKNRKLDANHDIQLHVQKTGCKPYFLLHSTIQFYRDLAQL